jgi:signal transduction histidine kinase
VLLTRLVDDLRTLALADAGELRLERRPADLAALVSASVERFRPQAGLRSIGLDFQAEPSLPPAWVDPARIEQILNNLLANALRFTPGGGRIDLHLARTGDWLNVTVQDSGPGIPVDALPHIFERFYRASRSRSREEGGAGLGLAIARQLAEAHGGALSAANRVEGGAEFSLTLPLSEA